jgi:hypothetical protein
MKTATAAEVGVAAESNGLYWGCQRAGGGHGEGDVMGFGPLENARISNPRYCRHPIDMTYKGSSDERELAKARLVPVIKTTTWVALEP